MHEADTYEPPANGVESARVRALEAELTATQMRLRAALDREAALAGELQHRIRNVLAVIRSTFSRTLDSGASPEEVADHFRGRLDALSRHHTRALGLRQRRTEIEDMVRDELLQVRADADARVSITGPPCAFGGRGAELFGLAIYELVTNSIKFGILSPGSSKGHLEIAWGCSSDRLNFRWLEKGITVLAPAPLPYGSGREFIEQSLPYPHDARTSFELAAGTLTCIIDISMGSTDDDLATADISAHGDVAVG